MSDPDTTVVEKLMAAKSSKRWKSTWCPPMKLLIHLKLPPPMRLTLGTNPELEPHRVKYLLAWVMGMCHLPRFCSVTFFLTDMVHLYIRYQVCSSEKCSMTYSSKHPFVFGWLFLHLMKECKHGFQCINSHPSQSCGFWRSYGNGLSLWYTDTHIYWCSPSQGWYGGLRVVT
jgi:hypothetical protein